MRRLLSRANEKIIVNDPLVNLSGTTLKVYFILLSSHRPLGVREVQKLAGFRSPNSARHHLEKLVMMGYAIKRDGGYVAVRPRSSLFSVFVILRGSILPKNMFYAISSTLFTLIYVYLRYPSIDWLVFFFASALSGILWLDTYNMYRRIKYLLKKYIY